MLLVNLAIITMFHRRDRYDVVEFAQDLWQGEPFAWMLLAVILGCITFFAVYKKVTGKSFVKSKRERREARKRRRIVLWEYQRED